ncbi:transcriptional regulator with GAF, ATPase, and Fis domain [Thalassospira sp. MBR-102]|jgi:transcriptional regulator with GAF, ATPase, and Fis domain|uniref:GAF domain-containing protein n=1 Tax=Thalassospira xiamenensis TaxID=220697 RepID=A0ABR5XZF6_9PROT|nr:MULTISPECIES: GAF domain-containing protein [Thalassospira]MBR9782074.1 GAF domain-containing protein [Rhodospirillales bacterium]KZD01016.1 hypothetical protein AUP40_21195 [Thalassospira xiamenensis]KZD08167.1 hypothetical protein AUP45_16985 [Thalassospira xiamenensis]MAB34023.1 GAF domain-containing protein [Thalassospira sp.]MAL29062.1 GAF domain-containing protein [Thalassospira sp.]|tara:strand:- start:98 stop:586 length:489 start_codon:yes stop_codon:yes gene_type:complete
MTDIDLVRLAGAYAAKAQPEASLDAIADLYDCRFKPRLMTFFAWDNGDDMCRRVWSNNPEKYPTSAKKKMGPTQWGQTVLRDQTPWFGKNETAMREAFPDHELIKSLGCSACLSVPVVAMGKSIGAISVLHEEGKYSTSDLGDLAACSALLVVPLLLLRNPI